MAGKIIVANYAALQRKYDVKALKPILAAVDRLIAADKARGIVSKIVDISSAAEMKRHKGKAVTSEKSGRQAKDAVDAIYAATRADYLAILDGPDVIPHLTLTNHIDDDPDDAVPSDLPYASDAAFTSPDPRRYTAVTRVVGRIPGLTGAKEPGYLIKQIDTAAKYKSLRRGDYLDHFAISAKAWEKSTAQSVKNIFGSGKLVDCPPKKSPDTAKLLSPLTHFINCHGHDVDMQFYGQRGRGYPVAMTSGDVAKGAKPNTIVAAECCFGAQLFDPEKLDGQRPIANTYLGAGAIAFLGSSNIAYGPSEGNNSADLVTQYFLIDVLEGASTGRALLQARQKFVHGEKMEDPVNVKTIAQFMLLGDPSLHPCRIQGARAEAIEGLDESAARTTRRIFLTASGHGAHDSSGFPGKKVARPPKDLHDRVRKIARSRGFQVKSKAIDFFHVVGGDDYAKEMKRRGVDQKVAILAESKRIKLGERGKKDGVQVRVLVAHAQDNRLIEVKEYLSR